MNMTQKVISEQSKLTLLVPGSPAYLNKHAAFSCFVPTCVFCCHQVSNVKRRFSEE